MGAHLIEGAERGEEVRVSSQLRCKRRGHIGGGRMEGLAFVFAHLAAPSQSGGDGDREAGEQQRAREQQRAAPERARPAGTPPLLERLAHHLLSIGSAIANRQTRLSDHVLLRPASTR